MPAQPFHRIAARLINTSLDAVPKARQPVERIAEIRVLMRLLRESDLSDHEASELTELLSEVPEKLLQIMNHADSREAGEFLSALRLRTRSRQTIAC